MTVKEIFDLRKQGKIEEAYEAIRPMYRVHKGHYTSLCMYHCAKDVFHLRLAEGRLEEAIKIYLALQKLVLFIDERDFGFTPKITLREGLRHFAEWYAEFYGTRN